MKIEIWNEKKEVEEQTLRLQLRKGEHGAVVLHAVNEDGTDMECSYLLSITPCGQLILHSSVNESLGLKLDSIRRLEVI